MGAQTAVHQCQKGRARVKQLAAAGVQPKGVGCCWVSRDHEPPRRRHICAPPLTTRPPAHLPLARRDTWQYPLHQASEQAAWLPRRRTHCWESAWSRRAACGQTTLYQGGRPAGRVRRRRRWRRRNAHCSAAIVACAWLRSFPLTACHPSIHPSIHAGKVVKKKDASHVRPPCPAGLLCPKMQCSPRVCCLLLPACRCCCRLRTLLLLPPLPAAAGCCHRCAATAGALGPALPPSALAHHPGWLTQAPL